MSKLPSKICLCGFMGAGKSVLGYRLASLLRRRFVDLDDFIVHTHKKAIADIFTEEGEASFREKERMALAALLETDETMVISLGGGALQTQEHALRIKQKCLLIYLKVAPDLLFTRLRKDKSRPKLRNTDGSRRTNEELKNLITAMLSEREPLYLMSELHYAIPASDTVLFSAEKLARTIKEHVS